MIVDVRDVPPAYSDAQIIAQSGQSTVFSAPKTNVQRRVGLKAFSVTSVGLNNALRRELAALTNLHDRRHVIQIYDLVESENGLWLEMELCPSSLNRWKIDYARQAGAPINSDDLADLIRFAAEAAAGLAAVHESGYGHGDVKPSNLFLDRENSVKVADLGVSQLDGRAAISEPVSGTRRYVAPEQARGEALSRSRLSGARIQWSRGNAGASLSTQAAAPAARSRCGGRCSRCSERPVRWELGRSESGRSGASGLPSQAVLARKSAVMTTTRLG